MYAAGGYDGHSCLNTVERFDLDKNLWSPVAQMSTRRSFPGVAVFDGRIYIFGGNDGTSFLNVVESYDPHIKPLVHAHPSGQTKGWHWSCSPGTMTSARDGVCLCTLGSHLVAVGGINGPSYLKSSEIYNPVNNTWELLASMETCRAAAGVAVVP